MQEQMGTASGFGRRRLRVLSVGCALLTASSCYYMSDPGPKPMGIRWEGDRLVAFLPVCAGDEVQSVEFHDETGAATAKEIPPPLWTASKPTEEQVKAGRLTLGRRDQFAQVAGPIENAPPVDFSIEYRTAQGHGSGNRFVIAKIPRQGYGPDEYWTSDDGIKSRSWLIDQVSCPTSTS
jgi:hypothetical protein